MTIRFRLVLLLFLLSPFLGKTQEVEKAVFLSINKEATAIDELLLKMNASLKKDKHKELEQQIHAIETALETIQKKSNELSLENSEKIYAITKVFKTDLSGFEKLPNKGKMFDNDKAMTLAFAPLQKRQDELRAFLRSAYSALVAAPQKENSLPPHTDSVATTKVQVRDTMATLPVTKTTEVIIQPPVPASGEINAQVLAAMREAESQIGSWIDSLHLAAKKNLHQKIRTLAISIAGKAAQMQDLSLLLNDGQKDNLKTLAGGLRQYAETLQVLSTKGSAAHEQMHKIINLMEIRLGVLATGLNLVK